MKFQHCGEAEKHLHFEVFSSPVISRKICEEEKCFQLGKTDYT